MNSWNGLKSIANNVKLYKLDISDIEKAYQIVFLDCDEEDNLFFQDVRLLIWDSGLKVGFNGRSNGYLVLYNRNNNGSVLEGDYYEKNYELAEENGFICKEKVEQDFDMVQSFDRLCDEIRNTLIYYVENAQIEEYQEQIIVRKKRLQVA